MQDGKRTRVAKINFLFLVQSITHLALHAEFNRNGNLLLFLLFHYVTIHLVGYTCSYGCIDDNFQIIKVLMFFIFCSKDRLWVLA